MGFATNDSLRYIFLGLDTSGPQTGLALVTQERILYETRSKAKITHNESLITLLLQAFEETGLNLEMVRGIGFTIGPGMWTSLRVGLSVIKGLALPRSLPVKGVNTLRAISETAGYDELPVLAVMDAKRGEVYAGLFYRERTVVEPRAMEPKQLASLVAKNQLGRVVVAGDGSELIKPVLSVAGIQFCDVGVSLPSPIIIARLGIKLLDKYGPDPIDSLEPVYLRRTDAEINREKRLG